jgi:quinol monooxygenase YgiN
MLHGKEAMRCDLHRFPLDMRPMGGDNARVMFGLVVRFDLRPGTGDEFDRLVETTTARIRAEEPGTLLYLCHWVRDEPDARIFYELYADRAAFQTHEVQPHVKEFHERRKPYTVGERVEFLDRLDGKGWPD